MCCNIDRRDNFEFFRQRYASAPSNAARRVEQQVLGTEVGLNGYTTLDQARRLVDLLRPNPDGHLLEIGAGHGWPGSFIAESIGAKYVATDFHHDALRATRDRLETHGNADGATAASADARALPFATESFDSIVHADVICCVIDKPSVLREIHRVLRVGGRVAGYTIHLPPGLTPREKNIASAVGPAAVEAEGQPSQLFEAAGLSVLVEEDVSQEYRDTCSSMIEARVDFEIELRVEDGDDVYDEELVRRRASLAGIDAGLLARSLIVAEKR